MHVIGGADNGPDTEEIPSVKPEPPVEPPVEQDLFDWLKQKADEERREREQQDEQQDETPAPNGKRGRPKGKERIKVENAYAKLRTKLPKEAIGPALLDREAEVKTGTAKRIWKTVAADYEAALMKGEVKVNGEVVPA